MRTKQDVYQAAVSRINRIFDDFENIYVSFSGGKDSGVMLNMTLDIARQRGRKVKVLFIDVEAHYSFTADFAERMFLANMDIIEPYWICLPMTTTNSVSMIEPWWIWWDSDKKDKWVRQIPDHDWVITESQMPLPYYYKNMTFEAFIESFASWQSETFGDTACMVGLRTQESLNRWRAIYREDKSTYKGMPGSTQVLYNCWNFYPLYDWRTEDIWTYNGKFGKDYNRLYDKMHLAGLPIHSMRVCEPYGDEQKIGLNLFRVIEPKTWARVAERVSGANFGNIYCGTKATGTRRIDLPEGHSWRTYCRFLLSTLPEDTATQYREKFVKFIQYWRKHGSPLSEGDIETLKELEGDNVVNTKTFSTRGHGDKYVVKLKTIPDELPTLDTKADFLSWKRMCMAIIKNDITCRTLSFSITKRQKEMRDAIIRKYKSIL